MRLFHRVLFPFALTLALAAIFFTPTAQAQDSSSMTGIVTDATGAAIPGVTIVLTNKATGVTLTKETNKQGSYTFPNVPPHEGYTATFSHQGFASVTVESLALNVGQTRTLDEKLNAGTSQAVVVSASNQQVTLDTTDAAIGNNIDPSQLNNLPIYDRTGGIQTLFYQQPGVDSNQGAVTGARIDQTSVTVDGLDVNDIAAGTTFAIVGNAPVDSVEQFTGTVAGLVPAVGTGSGAQFQLVTKSGTNKFHGNINEYHRDTTTVANTWFNNLVGLPRTPLIRNQFGGNIGGPIKRDKLFFFFDLADSRIVQSSSGNDTVPLPNLTNTSTPTLNYINSNQGCDATSRLNTTPTCISSLSQTQVAALDPANEGFDPNVVAFMSGRYPAPNDLTEGDGVNTGGYRFTYPTPDNEITYIGRIDYNLSANHKIFGRFTINRENATQSLPVFPTDPVTHPFIDRSYGYVVSDIWTIGRNKVNEIYYGDNISKYDFPNSYNPTGVNAYSFSGGLSGPYSGTDGQKRRVPIPVVRDDFNWQVGNHSLAFGGTFKFIKTNSNLINNFNFVGIGEQGAALGSGLVASVRPADINQVGSAGVNDYDAIFPDELGVIGDISTNYTYTKSGSALPLAGGGPRAYRYFETEAYFGDTWKLNSKLTLSYGVRYQLYSVPYEAHGDESVEFTTATDQRHTTLNAYVNDRIAQQNAGNTSVTGLPIYEVELGGKANNGPSLYAPSYKDFAPRFAFAYTPLPKTVFSGSAGIVYDRTVINAINFLQDQISYLFSNTQVNQFGGSTVPASLLADTRVGSGLSYPASLNPPPAALTVPYVPYVDDAAGDVTGVPGQPYGLGAGETNFVISPTLKDPYSVALNLGVQQEFPGHFLMRLNYVGRLGRRLLADADAGQVIDVPDYTGGSTQSMAQAFAGLTTQTRACQNAGIAVANCPITPQPWFEDVLGPYQGLLGSNTALVNAMVGQLAPRGDISDMLYTMGYYTELAGFTGFLPTNIGIPSQFGSNAYLVNQGNSNYHGLLLTLTKNMSNGLSFNFNYTWSHSIDNTSESANANALFSNSGFICDITKPRACRASSDFDVRQEINSNFVYELPFGRGKQFGANMPIWADEAVGGWSISGLPSYRTGLAVTPYSDTYLASFDNQNPAIFFGNKGDLKAKVNVNNSVVWNFAGGAAGATKVFNEFRGPIGIEYGQRNLLNGPGAFFLDAGLAKVFPIYGKFNLNFRADAFNILNHPAFGTPAVNIVGNQSQFGQITGTANEPGAGYSARVAQFSLRLEF